MKASQAPNFKYRGARILCVPFHLLLPHSVLTSFLFTVNMAPARKETSAELCKRVTAQGNTIAIRMLEYLSSAKNPIPGFQTLATDFIELCQVLWTIEAGLTEAAKSHNTLPVEVAQELDKRVRQINDEFVVLSQMVTKFIDNENHKGGFGRRFRMMYVTVVLRMCPYN